MANWTGPDREDGPTGALPSLNAPKPPAGAQNTPTIPPITLAPVSITHSGNDIKLSGDTPTVRRRSRYWRR